MNINMPIMNGLKVIQMSRLKHPDTAFVIVSSYEDFSYCREALRLQITDYILKPVNYEEFGVCIGNLMFGPAWIPRSKSFFCRWIGAGQSRGSGSKMKRIISIPVSRNDI